MAKRPAAEGKYDCRREEEQLSEVTSHYVAQVYRQTGSYEETARRVELDGRTVKSKVQEYLSETGICG